MLTFGSLTHGLTGRVSESLPPTNKTRDTHKGHPGLLCRSGGIIALRLPATSIGATAHRADRLFRLRNPPTRFPPLEVVGGFPHGLTGRVSGSLPSTNKNPDNPQGVSGFLCRSGGIRTRGLLVPNQTRYQTALHLDTGADEGTRTPDLLITNRLLYQLSHIGTTSKRYYNKGKMVCPALFLRAGSTPDQ